MGGLLKETAKRWMEDDAQRLGAALAYYTIFSLAPLLVIVSALVGLTLGEEAARGAISTQLESVFGPQNARTVEAAVARLEQPAAASLSAVLGFLFLVFGATGVVVELKDALNRIWRVPTPRTGWKQFLRDRVLSLAFVLALGFLLLVSLILTTFTAAAGRFLSQWLPLPEAALQGINMALSFAFLVAVFAAILKGLPDAPVRWRDVWLGAALTAVLFSLGNLALSYYLGASVFISAYGAAGSVVAILLWAYYCAQILYFGAEFTRVHASARGSPAVFARTRRHLARR